MTNDLMRFIDNNIINNYGLNRINIVGNLMEIIYIVKPKDLNDWKEYYIKFLKENNREDKIKENIKSLCERICYNQDLVWECLMLRCIDKTYDGYKREIQARDYLIKLTGMEVIKTDQSIDRKYAVDYIIDNRLGIQIKSISYFESNNPKITEDKNRNKILYNKFKNDFGFEVIEIGFNDNQVNYNKDLLNDKIKELQKK